MKKADIIVIGAGVSGLHLAYKLATYGLNTLVLEKKSSIDEDIICTGIVSYKLFEEFDVSKNCIITPLRQVRIISPYDSTINYTHPLNFAYIVNRQYFNSILANKAREQGVEIRLSSEVNRINVNKDNVEVYSNEKYIARSVVISTGVNYKLNRQLNLGIPANYLKGVQIDITSDKINIPTLFIGNQIAPGAFAWALPILDSHLRIGLITTNNPKKYLINLFHKLGYDVTNNSSIAINAKYKPIAQGICIPSITDRVIAVGEAAGQVKTTTGGGIYFGMACAEIAAEIIKKCFDKNNFSYNSLKEYEKQWHTLLKREIITGYKIRRTCSLLSDSVIENIFSIIKYDGILNMVQSCAEFDLHVDLLNKIIKRLSLLTLKNL